MKVLAAPTAAIPFTPLSATIVGCGWSVEQIDQHLRQFPDGIGGRYFSEGRLSREITRSVSKYQARALPLLDGWKAPETIIEAPASKISDPDDDELDELPKPRRIARS